MATNYDSLGWTDTDSGCARRHGSWKGDNTNGIANHRGSEEAPRSSPISSPMPILAGGIWAWASAATIRQCGLFIGPFLAAAFPPTDGVPQLDTITLINHPSSNRRIVIPDYHWTPIGGGNPPNPSGGVGYWDWTDEIFGAGCWIDLPDKHGLVIMPSLGHGHLKYWQAGVSMERVEIHRRSTTRRTWWRCWSTPHPGARSHRSRSCR